MPYRRTGGRGRYVRRTARTARRRAPRYRRFMGRTLASKRMNNTDTRVFYFKQNGKLLQPTTNPYQTLEFKAHDILENITNWPQFASARRLYDEYKVLAMRVKYFPSSYRIDNVSGPSGFNRGETITWVDQQFDEGTVTPTSISDVINDSSAKMRRPYSSFTNYVKRASGFSAWGKLNAQSAPPVLEEQLDSWNGLIGILIDGISNPTPPTTTPRNLYYWVWTMKVVFRGRTT